MDESSDIRKLSDCIRQLPDGQSDEYQWPNAVLRLIDCVLSLNRRYDSFVVPRVNSFQRSHPEVDTLTKLWEFIQACDGPIAFFESELDYWDVDRARVFNEVLHYLMTKASQCEGRTEMEKFRNWAISASPSGFVEMNICGFGLSGWQYLRMVLGADTVKPDRHIKTFVRECIGKPVSDQRALRLMEQATKHAGRSLREVDNVIWQRYARGNKRTCIG